MSNTVEARGTKTVDNKQKSFYIKKTEENKMKKLYSGIVLNGEELLESNSNRIELEYYKILNDDVKNSKVYGLEIVKKEYIRKRDIRRKAKHNQFNDKRKNNK